jgi:hypothetical protein
MHEQRRYQKSVLKYDKESPLPKMFPWKRFIGVLSVVAFLVVIIVLIRAPRFQVKTVTVTGTNVTDPLDVSDFVMTSLSGRYLLFLPKTSILLVSTDQLAQKIKDHFPRFKTVVVERGAMDVLTVTTVEHGGAYLWCDPAEICSFMDTTGTVFADAPYFSGSAYLKIFIGQRAPYPFQPITAEQVALVTKIKEHLEAIDITPLSFSFDTEHKLSVVFVHGVSRVTIFLDPASDVDSALETLYSGLRTEPMLSLYHNTKNVLEYLDVRFSKKLIYKFK